MRLVLVLVALASVADARPARGPAAQSLTCPNDADECELEITGKVVDARRETKWDTLRISTTANGKATVVYSSINIPHRTRLKLKLQTRYRFTIGARKPFGVGDLWVIDAKRP